MKRSILIPAALLALLLAAGCARSAGSDASAAAEPVGTPAVTAPATERANPTATPGVYLDGFFCSENAQVLPLTGRRIPARELAEALSRLPEVRRVEMRDAPYTPEERAMLRERYPSVVFQWPVELLGETFLSTASEISFAGREDLTKASLEAIRDAMDEFFSLYTVDLTGCGFENDTLFALSRSLGDTDVRWRFDLCGVEVCSTDREIDLSDHKLRDRIEELESALPFLSRLQKVVMCDCGVDNETMAALNEKYEHIRFVWMVDIEWAAIRTDNLYFTPYAASGVRQTRRLTGLKNLKYCPDLIALDIGHCHTQDLSYLAVMPHLRYLILAENYVTDITLVGELKELKWLEMFQCVTRDLSPLLGCTALEDLNICYISTPGDNVYETLRQMTWLKRLWCSGTRMSKAQLAALREELPDCEIWCRTGDESTGSTWRYSESYYEMRDAFHMYYMGITGNQVARLDAEGLEKMHKRFWKD